MGISKIRQVKPKTNIKAIVFFLYFSFFALILVFIVESDIKRLIALLPDDCSYYFQIAENFVKGRGLSFDGIHQTNGFQPLWLYALILVNGVISGTPEMMLRVFLVFQLLLIMGATYLFYFSLSQFLSKRSLFLGSFIYLAYVVVNSLNGMESALLLLTISFVFYSWVYLEKFNPNKKIFHLILGVAVGLMLLTRLDTVFIAFSLYLAILIFRFKWPEIVIRLSLSSLGTLAVLTPYLLNNYYSFGRIMPISGALKSTFPVAGKVEVNIFHGFSVHLIAFFALGYLLSIIFDKRTYTTKLNAIQILLFAFSVGIILHYLNYILFMRWGIYDWHFLTYYLFIAILLCEFTDRGVGEKNRSRIFFNVLLVFVSALLIIRLTDLAQIDIENSFPVTAYEAAKYIDENSDPEAIFAMTDAGIFGYFSRRQVINLDGLVNDFEYQEYLRDKQLNLYLQEESVDYFVHHAVWHHPQQEAVATGEYDILHINLYSHLYQTLSDELLLYKENEVYRSPYFEGPNATAFLIWEINSDPTDH